MSCLGSLCFDVTAWKRFCSTLRSLSPETDRRARLTLRPPRSGILHRVLIGFQSEEFNVNLLLMTLQTNNTGAFQRMIQAAKYESPPDQSYVQNLPTIFEELNLPNT